MNLDSFYDNSSHTDTAPKGTGGSATETTVEPGAQDIAGAFSDRPSDPQETGQETEVDATVTSDDDPGAKLFGDTLHADTHLIPTDTEGVDGEQLAQANQIFRAELHKVGVLNPKVGEELSDILQDAWHSPLSDAELAQEQTQTAGELAHTYGVDGARERIDLAKAVLARSPMLKNAVEVLELGNSYDLIEKLADVGRELRKAGKLK